jgi:hypothetical protein
VLNDKVVVDAANSGRHLDCHADRLLHRLGINDPPQLHGAVVDDDIDRRKSGPRLSIQPRHHLLTDGQVIDRGAFFGRLALSNQGLHEVRTAHGPNDLPLLHDRNAFDPVPFEERCNLPKRRVGRRRDDLASHDVGNLACMRLHIFGGERRTSNQQLEPPGAASLDARFGAPYQITFANDSDQFATQR